MSRKNNLTYGRPKDTNFRKYYNDTKFNFNNLVRKHFNETQLIQCERGHEFSFELYETIKKYNNQCPTCIADRVFSNCNVIVSNKELIDKIKELEERSLQLNDENEYNILIALYQNQNQSQSYREISELLDCSQQFICKRTDKLIELGLLEIDENQSMSSNKKYFRLTQKSKEMLSSV